jgi:hypothetical protein
LLWLEKCSTDPPSVQPRSDAGGSELAVKTRSSGRCVDGTRADGVLLDEQRLDADVKRSFDESDGDYGSPRVRADLREWGWKVTNKTVEASMGPGARRSADARRFRSLTRPDKAAAPAPHLVQWDFTAAPINVMWCGDLTEIPPACRRRSPVVAQGETLEQRETLFIRSAIGSAAHRDR